MPEERGRRIGRYEILREIGRGGMGVVYEARRDDGDVVALKVLSPSRSGDEDSVRRFLREGAIARRLRHPNIVRIHEVGQVEELCYIAMDLHLGPNLEDLVFELRRDRRDALEVFLPEAVPAGGKAQESDLYQHAIAQSLAQVAKAVEYAHQQGLVHRDIKPGNILIAGPGRLLLTDFGLVRELDTETKTLTGDLLGTPLYMSPEQIMGRRDLVGPRSDVYALGATLHECLGLQAPYDATDLTRLARQIETDEPRSLAALNPSLPRMLVTITRRAMSKRPEDRYAGAALFANDLERFVAGRSIVARPPDTLERLRNALRRRPDLVVITATLLVAGLVFGGVLLWRDRAERERRGSEARQAFLEGREHLGKGSFRSAWGAAAEAESLAPEAVYGPTLREDVEAALLRDFNARLIGGLDGLLQIDGIFAMLDDLPGNEVDREALAARRDLERRRAIGRNATIDDPRVELVFEAIARDRPDDLPALRLELAPIFTRVFTEKTSRFLFLEASRLVDRARRWGVTMAPLSGAPDEAEDLTRPGHMELQSIAAELFADDPQVRRRALVRLSDSATFSRLPWSETTRLLERFARELEDENDAREFLRLADRLALPGFGETLVDLAQRFPKLERPLVELAGNHPDPALTEFLLGVHGKSGRPAMEPAIVGALRAATAIEPLMRQLEYWKEHEGAGLRLLLLVLDRRMPESAAFERRLDELVKRIDDDEHLAPVFEVLARRGRELDPARCLPLLRTASPELRMVLAGALPEADFRAYLGSLLGAEDPLEVELGRRLLAARPAKAPELLLAILDDPNADLDDRALACFALGLARDEKIEARLVEAGSSPMATIRRSALSGLARKDGSDRRGGRFAIMFQLARDRFNGDPDVEVRAAAVELIRSLRAHELAGELTRALESWQPDVAADLIGRLFGEGDARAGIARAVESFGLAPFPRPNRSRSSNREVLAIALCTALEALGLEPDWDGADTRRRAVEALLDLAGREDVSLDLARAAWEALDSFRDEAVVEELVDIARGLSRADVAAVAGRTLIRRGAAEQTVALLAELPVTSPSSRAVMALAYLELGRIFDFEEELVRAWVAGLRDLGAFGTSEKIRSANRFLADEIDARLRFERLAR